MLERFRLREYRDAPASVLPEGVRKLLDIAMALAVKPRDPPPRRADERRLGRREVRAHGPRARRHPRREGDRAVRRARHGHRAPLHPARPGLLRREGHRRRRAGGGARRRGGAPATWSASRRPRPRRARADHRGARRLDQVRPHPARRGARARAGAARRAHRPERRRQDDAHAHHRGRPLAQRPGSLTFDGRPLRGVPSHARARLGIGYMPEDRRIIPQLTVEENVLPPGLGRRARRTRPSGSPASTR